MKFYRFSKNLPLVLALFCVMYAPVRAQNKNQIEDKLPVREYTNPDEIVTFDRTTPFSRALDVINEFAQKYRNKMVIDRTKTEGNIGISVPPMHWMDALKLILNVKKLNLVEQKDYYEIVTPQSLEPQAQVKQGNGSGGSGNNGEGPVATTHSKEVRIKAIFFEGNRRALKEIGVDWSTISENVPDAILNSGNGGSSGGNSGGSSGGNSGGSSGQLGPQIPNSSFNGPFVQVNAKGAQSVSQNVFNSLINVGEIGNTGIRVQALFSAFEADNLGQILASPNIKVLDGQEGRIQVGQDFSIKQRDFSGNVVDKFFSVGTILQVTPTVIDQQDTTFIHLDIHAERSNAQPDPVSTVINKQQAETEALLLDGESTVIAGLYNTESTEVRKGVPILKDLPAWFFGLRYLFGYNSKDLQTRELVILIQASLEPTIPQRVSKEGNFEDKYEVLRDERQDMHDELKHGQKVLNGELKNKMDEQPVPEEADTTSEEQSMVKESKPEQQKPNKEETHEYAKPKQKDVAKQQKKHQEAPEVSDPEVQTQKITLDLGSVHENDNADSLSNRENSTKKTTKNKVNAQTQSGNNTTNNGKTYYIVGGSFKKEGNAEDFRDKLNSQGFNSKILQKGNFMFVTYQTFNNLETAKTALADIQQNQNSDAWLYVKR